jgi:hypothetical protein
MKEPSPERLRALLDYDPKTGILTWKPRTGHGAARWNSKYAGTRAGSRCPDGNILIKIDDRSYLAHRLIWAMEHGTFPECVVHRNGKRDDNRLKNLRAMTRKAIQRRPVLYRLKTSGIRGVSFNSKTGKWCDSIRVDDVTISRGSYATKEEAAKAPASAAAIGTACKRRCVSSQVIRALCPCRRRREPLRSERLDDRPFTPSLEKARCHSRNSSKLSL